MGAGPTLIKICGITRLSDARAAVRAGANAIGFVFAPSPRRVSPLRAKRIAGHVHPSVRKFGVFVDGDPEGIAEIVDLVGLDAVQLYDSDEEAVLALRRAYPRLLIAGAVRADRRQALDRLEEGIFDAIFVDPKDVSDPGVASRPIPVSWLEGLGVRQLVVSGGLSPENVANLVRRVRPWGVDVSGGVESSPGKKDPDKVRRFVRAVREMEGAA